MPKQVIDPWPIVRPMEGMVNEGQNSERQQAECEGSSEPDYCARARAKMLLRKWRLRVWRPELSHETSLSEISGI
jgi:hypothetical protein